MLGLGIFVVKGIDPISYHGYISIPVIYTVQDSASYLIFLVMFITLFEACNTCYHQLHLYSQTPVSPIPNILACLLILLWIIVCMAIFMCDIYLIRTDNTIWRGIVYLIYVAMFLFIFLLFQWIGSDLNSNFHLYIPSMFGQYKFTYWGKVRIILLGAYGGNMYDFWRNKTDMRGGTKNQNKNKEIPQHRISETITDEGESGVYHAVPKTDQPDADITPIPQVPSSQALLNPLLARLYRKFIRFLTFRRVAQMLMVFAVGILTYDGLRILYFDPGAPLSSAGDYNLNDDILSWLQGLALVTGIWYCWIPYRSIATGKDMPESLRSFDTSTIQAGGFIDSQFASQVENDLAALK